MMSQTPTDKASERSKCLRESLAVSGRIHCLFDSGCMQMCGAQIVFRTATTSKAPVTRRVTTGDLSCSISVCKPSWLGPALWPLGWALCVATLKPRMDILTTHFAAVHSLSLPESFSRLPCVWMPVHRTVVLYNSDVHVLVCMPCAADKSSL